MEPSAQDVAAVAAALGGQPVPAPAPAQQQPVQPTPQPTPSQQPAEPVQPTQTAQPTEPSDPFASLFASEPVAAPAQPTQPTEPVAPVQPTAVPAEPGQPAAPVQPTEPVAPKQQTYEEYIDSITSGVPKAPVRPDPMAINPDDPTAIKGFFDDMFVAAKAEFKAEYARDEAIRVSENNLWNEAMDKYGSLRSNKELRGMVHAIRMDEFNRGIAITPTQAADRLLAALKGQYNKGVADNQVVTTIEQVQPTGGGGTTIPTSIDSDKALLAVQTGGETALAQILDAQFKAQG